MRAQHRSLALVVAASIALAACAKRAVEVTTGSTTTTTTTTATTTQWTATLAPQNGSNVQGTVSVKPGASTDQTLAAVTITGAPAGGVHPWHIHAGKCGDNGPIVGPASAYPNLQADANGTATVNATLPIVTPAGGDFSVNVHLSPAEMGTIVACGNLGA